ncbi:MAG: xanthine dehydrogenase family protein subunit M [Bacillota bacterium]
MKKNFLYFEPATVAQAIADLKESGAGAWRLAGGTDLLVRMKRREINPDALVNLKSIPELAGTGAEESGFRLGALTTVAALLRNEEAGRLFPALRQAAAVMASPQIRELATLGGNVCNASPAADLVPPLVAAGAQAVIAGDDSTRTVPLEEFFRGPRETVLRAQDILTAVIVPWPSKNCRSVYLKQGIRRGHEIAIAGVAVSLVRHEKNRLADVRIVLGAVGPTVLRARKAEEFLRQHTLSEAVLAEAGGLAARAAQPVDDVRASAWYRREMVRVLTIRALQFCLAGGGDE